MKEGGALAIFGKKSSGDGSGESQNAAGEPTIEVSAEKAKRFFDHARAMHDSGQFEYAMSLWLQGLKWSPSDLSALERFAQSAGAFMGDAKARLSKETVRNIEGKREVDRYASALLQWGTSPRDATAAVKAAEGAAKIDEASDQDMSEVVYWIAERALALIPGHKSDRGKKDLYVRLMAACRAARVYDLAVTAGDLAVKLDPSDAELSTQTRNLAAQATMSTGGYAGTGEAGGFRANVRDSEQQRILEERDRIVKTEDVKDRLVRVAQEEYERRPGDLPTVRQYVKALKERGRDEDEKLAYRLLTKAYEETKQFQLKVEADEIRLRQARRALAKYREAAESEASNPQAQENYARATRKYLEMEAASLREQVEAYPTDLRLKHELGKRELQLGNFDSAIALFQESQQDPKFRASSLAMLGESFFRQDWLDEAIDTYRRALEDHDDPRDAAGLELRYGLMRALQKKAIDEGSLEVASEAEKIASSIAIQQINFRDIKDRRNELKELVGQLKQRQAS